VFAPDLDVQQAPKWREEGWSAFLIIQPADDYVDLVGFDTAECLRLHCNSKSLNNVLPLAFAKKLSEDRLSLSYYHGGVRSRIVERFKFKVLDKRADEANE
jgi:hypothetical protein